MFTVRRADDPNLQSAPVRNLQKARTSVEYRHAQNRNPHPLLETEIGSVRHDHSVNQTTSAPLLLPSDAVVPDNFIVDVYVLDAEKPYPPFAPDVDG